MLTLYLTASRTVGSFLIRAFTWSKWSHVFIQDGDNAIEAHWMHGVRSVPLEEALRPAKRMAKVQVAVKDEQAVLEAIRAQIGKPYDYLAIVGFLFRNRKWNEDDAWECAELIAHGFDKAGEPLFRSDSVPRIVPEHFWLLAPGRLV